MQTPLAFGARHLTAVGFMVEADQVKEAMKHQHAQLIEATMPECKGLEVGAFYGNGEITERTGFSGRERKNISGVIVTEELVVELAKRPVVGYKAGERTAFGYRVRQRSGEGCQCLLLFF